MFGLTFLFSAALFALPLAGLPVILHLLFRKKSPVVMFPTLRFIKSSVQRTAARKRVPHLVEPYEVPRQSTIVRSEPHGDESVEADQAAR